MQEPGIHKQSKFRLVWYRFRYGLVLFSLRNLLAKIGVDIEPYYWFLEEKNACDEPIIKDDINDYTIDYVGIEEVRLMDKTMGLNGKVMVEAMLNGQLCIGLRHKGTMASLLSIEPNDFIHQHRHFTLEEHAAYLLNVYTFRAYRGKNLAPYLKYHSFKLLEKYDIDKLYSINSYFNTSSLKVKKKMGARKLKLYLYVELFKKRHWNFILKEYPESA